MLFVNKENPHVFYFEEKMFTKEIKDGREAPLKPCLYKNRKICQILYIILISEYYQNYMDSKRPVNLFNYVELSLTHFRNTRSCIVLTRFT